MQPNTAIGPEISSEPGNQGKQAYHHGRGLEWKIHQMDQMLLVQLRHWSQPLMTIGLSEQHMMGASDTHAAWQNSRAMLLTIASYNNNNGDTG